MQSVFEAVSKAEVSYSDLRTACVSALFLCRFRLVSCGALCLRGLFACARLRGIGGFCALRLLLGACALCGLRRFCASARALRLRLGLSGGRFRRRSPIVLGGLAVDLVVVVVMGDVAVIARVVEAEMDAELGVDVERGGLGSWLEGAGKTVWRRCCSYMMAAVFAH